MANIASYILMGAAIRKALETPNYKVAVLSKNESNSRAALRMCFEMVTPLLGEGEAKLLHQAKRIQFGNGSSIIFRSDEEHLRGLQLHDTVRD